MIAVDPSRTALLVMDMQQEVTPILGDRASAFFERTAGVIAAARKARWPVLYVVVGFRPGYPELKTGTAMQERVAKMGGFIAPEVVPQLKPEPHEPVIVKKRVSAFSGSDLDVVLRAKGIDTLVLAGISTSGVVLSTVRQAGDLDFKMFVVRDCCADPDEEVHRMLMEKLFARQTTVVTAADVTG